MKQVPLFCSALTFHYLCLMVSNELISYLIDFMAGEALPDGWVGYTANEEDFAHYRLVFVPSGFFQESTYGTASAMPAEPLTQLEGVPVLFGKPEVCMYHDTLVVHADLPASAFFLMTRYEEMWQTDRDVHNRFDAQHALAQRAGFLHRPLVDEYGTLIRKWLVGLGCHLISAKKGFGKIYLTHDVDTLDYYHHLRGTLGGIKRIIMGGNEKWMDILRSWIDINNDVAYTFPWLLEQDKKLSEAEIFFFIKAAGKERNLYDRPVYDLQTRSLQGFNAFCTENTCKIGLHASYASGGNATLITEEKKRLEEAFQKNVTANRYHYLRTCSVDDMQALADAGIMDDFTMAFADRIGFRMGTSRPFKWINPKTMSLTNLTIHPMSVMECTLMSPNYMNLQYSQAIEQIKQLMDKIYQYNGEVVLLWHNTSVMDPQGDYARLYIDTLDYIAELQNVAM